MNIIFRVDSSSYIGIGHLMRCLTLAEQYKKNNITFAVQSLKGNYNQKIIDKGYKLVLLADNSIDELSKNIELLNIEFIIFDHYDIDDKFEKSIKDKTGIHILSFDDTYKKHYCDILLNHNIYADASKYNNLVPKSCEIRCGKEYTLIRDEFKKTKLRKRPINNKRPVIFVSLGGADKNNISLIILKILTDFNNIIVNIAVTNSNQNIVELKNYTNHLKNFNICVDCKIAEMMNNSDVAIITPSVIVHEVMFMKLPFISIMTADNQEEMYQYLFKNNYPVFRENELNLLSKEIIKYA
jgi:UDP-2,4-diacetamido-2,4,6-trideoxy-beta-L-altropyranose hydrolase